MGELLADETPEPEVAAEPTPEPAAAPPVAKLEDASKFVQDVAELEGDLRLEACKEGCCCKMEVRGIVTRRGRHGAVLQLGTLHDQMCPWLHPDTP